MLFNKRGQVVPDEPKKGNWMVWTLVGLIVVCIIVLFFIFKGDNSAQTGGSQQKNLSSTNLSAVKQNETALNLSSPPAFKEVESTTSVTQECAQAAQKKDENEFCLNFRKIDIDGLNVFVNCANSEITKGLSATDILDCSSSNTTASAVCKKYNLNVDEFVSAAGEVTTCGEANLA